MKTLFNSRKFYDLANSYISSLDNKINKLTKIDFERSSIDDFTRKYTTEYTFNIPELDEEEIFQKKPEDTKIRIERRGSYGSGTVLDGTKYTLVIPFKGDSSLFEIFPTSYLSILPFGEIISNEIHIVFEIPVGKDVSRIKADFDSNLITIKKYLDFLSEDANQFNNKLEPAIKITLEKRKAKLDKDDDIANSFGFPIR